MHPSSHPSSSVVVAIFHVLHLLSCEVVAVYQHYPFQKHEAGVGAQLLSCGVEALFLPLLFSLGHEGVVDVLLQLPFCEGVVDVQLQLPFCEVEVDVQLQLPSYEVGVDAQLL